MEKAVVLWTGGKDSALALFESMKRFSIDRLVTFVPEPYHKFYAHPIELIQAQAQCIGLRHQLFQIKKPFVDSYRNALSSLRDDGLRVVITGDIATVAGCPNWIKECAEGILEVYMPLWGVDRLDVLNRLRSNRFKVICSLAYKKIFRETITGRHLNQQLIEQLSLLNRLSGLDICGENGEYHTWVISAPFFKRRLEFINLRLEEAKDFFYLEFDR
ncbi:MAG TPA: diphthine--ammonia ligase, partial [Nitrococcus sp.]|nr:diphthine--ammonia ligase [Nitrococcus sp.]